MDLETAKLVAFALWAESYEGVTGKDSDRIRDAFHFVAQATSIDELRDWLGDDLAFKLDNYLTVWETTDPAPVPPTEQEEVEAVEISRDQAANALRKIGHTEGDINAALGPPEQEAQILTTADVGKLDITVSRPAEDKPQPKKRHK